MKNYYTILEIEETATQEEIKEAFRRLAKKCHPDNIYTGNEEKFKEVLEAYNVLSDLEKRKNYDRKLRENNTTFSSSSYNRGSTSQTQSNTNSYYQYTSYTKTREESERDMDNLMKDILKKYRKSQKSSPKEEFIHVDSQNINLSAYYEMLNYMYRNQDWDQKEENITYTKKLRK